MAYIDVPTNAVCCNLSEIDAALQRLSETSAAVALESRGDLETAREAAAASVDHVAHILSGGKLISSIVNDVLDLSKIREGKLSVSLRASTAACGRAFRNQPDSRIADTPRGLQRAPCA